MSFDWFVAIRYLREGRAQTWLVIGASAIGVTVLVFLSALITGIEGQIIDRTLGSQAHVTVKPEDEDPRALTSSTKEAAASLRVEPARERVETIDNWPELRGRLTEIEGVRGVSPTASGSAVAVKGTRTRAITLRGVEPDAFTRVFRVEPRIIKGRYAFTGREALIGKELASDFGIGVGDRVRVEVNERADVFTVRGIFDLGNKDTNQRWVVVPLRAAQSLFGFGAGITSFELSVEDIFTADVTAQQAAARTALLSESWKENNLQLLSALNSQRSSKNTLQFFITLAVALGIASVLIVNVVQKSREIGILRATGTSKNQILRIFLLQGLIVGVIGAVIGDAFGFGLAFAFTRVMRNVDGSPLLPLALDAPLLTQAFLLSALVGLIAAAAPARRAAQLDPAEAMRHV